MDLEKARARAVGHRTNAFGVRNIRLNHAQAPGLERILRVLQDLVAGDGTAGGQLLDACAAALVDRQNHDIADDVSSHCHQGNLAVCGNRGWDRQVDLIHAGVSGRALIEDGRQNSAQRKSGGEYSRYAASKNRWYRCRRDRRPDRLSRV